jgi:hypothetical protein
MDPVVARKTWRTLEPLHGLIYFAPEAVEEYAALGIGPELGGYFASRAAPMGAVPAEVVIATFYNFCPVLVRRSIPRAWEITTPEAILAARLRAADRALVRVLGDEVDDGALGEAAALAREAALRAVEHPEGRALFAGHAGLAWPDGPRLVLWHAQSLLREFRGDAHVALLVEEGVSGIEALVIHGATGEVPPRALQSTRGWTDDQWAQAVDALRTRGWIGADGGLTDAGRTHRQRVEDRTDALALAPYAALGESRCDRLRTLARPFARAVVESGAFGFRG